MKTIWWDGTGILGFADTPIEQAQEATLLKIYPDKLGLEYYRYVIRVYPPRKSSFTPYYWETPYYQNWFVEGRVLFRLESKEVNMPLQELTDTIEEAELLKVQQWENWLEKIRNKGEILETEQMVKVFIMQCKYCNSKKKIKIV